ncbi:hypothetical protein COS83_03965 [archaeon CG07_land_8_20_14_0_80_38_8]|nr:MAG: hypothetical protein COS83_03965 [archaeon CG07_land_8_20_14_0_80_38_8]PIU88075.1 MAG: hypothetical protein COS64_04860 [archaeon CG06_land_8_20_14_3_00_37_11]
MNAKKTIIIELCMIFASVIIFRSLWILLDKNPFFSTNFALIIMIIIGVSSTGVCLYFLNKK